MRFHKKISFALALVIMWCAWFVWYERQSNRANVEEENLLQQESDYYAIKSYIQALDVSTRGNWENGFEQGRVTDISEITSNDFKGCPSVNGQGKKYSIRIEGLRVFVMCGELTRPVGEFNLRIYP